MECFKRRLLFRQLAGKGTIKICLQGSESLLMLFQKAYAENKGTSKVEKIIVTNEMGRLSQEEIKRMVRKAKEFADDNDKLADKLETDEKGKIEAVQLSIKEQVEVMVVAMAQQMTMMNMVSFRSLSYIDKRLEEQIKGY
ncbi:luminal binding protein [Tanacetum coccineum]